MANRPGATPPNGTSVWPVFEDFEPKSQWQQDNESHILNIDLPGFTKEQLRVSTEGRDVIRVRGECLVFSNKWARFLKDFVVPKNCDMNSVRAKFQGGNLTITVCKKIVGIPNLARPPETTPTDAPKQPTPQKGRHESESSPPPPDHLRTKQSQPDVPRDARNNSPFRNSGGMRKESIEFKEKYVAPETTESATKKTVEKDGSLPADESAKKATLKAADRVLPATKTKKSDRESKDKQTFNPTGGDYSVLTVEKYKKTVKGLSEMNEEIKFLVNMGVAVLVVMAVTAYATYKFVSREDQK